MKDVWKPDWFESFFMTNESEVHWNNYYHRRCKIGRVWVKI